MNGNKILLVLSALFLLGNLQAQMVPTQSGVFLYFDPAVIQKNKIRHLFISQHERYLAGKKTKLSRPFSKSEILFDSTGRPYCTVQLWKGGTDTVRVHKKYELPKFTAKPYRLDEGADGSRTYWIAQGREERMLSFDSLGNEVLNEEVYKPVDLLAYVRRHSYAFDANNRMVQKEFSQSELKYNKEERDWDTLPKIRDYEKYVYENERLVRIDVYNGEQKEPGHSLLFTYSKDGLLQRVEGTNTYSKEHPVRLVLMISTSRNDEPFEPVIKKPQ